MLSKRVLRLVVGIAFGVAIGGCGGRTPAPASPGGSPPVPPERPAPGQSAQVPPSTVARTESSTPSNSVKVNISTGTTAGVFYFLGDGLAQLWNQKVPGINASSRPTDGSVANMNLMARKESDVALTVASVAREAFLGEDRFKGRPVKDLRVIAAIYPNYNQLVVRADSGIEKVTDLIGKRFVPGAKGSAPAIDALRILEAYGLDESDLMLDYVAFTEALELMQNNQAQATMIQAALPTPAIAQAARSFELRVLPIEQAVLDKLIRDHPVYQVATVPANTYRGQAEAVRTLGRSNLLVVRAELDAETVYQMTRAVFENAPALARAHRSASDISLERALTGLAGVPLHPGAERFYKEKGLIK